MSRKQLLCLCLSFLSSPSQFRAWCHETFISFPQHTWHACHTLSKCKTRNGTQGVRAAAHTASVWSFISSTVLFISSIQENIKINGLSCSFYNYCSLLKVWEPNKNEGGLRMWRVEVQCKFTKPNGGRSEEQLHYFPVLLCPVWCPAWVSAQ